MFRKEFQVDENIEKAYLEIAKISGEIDPTLVAKIDAMKTSSINALEKIRREAISLDIYLPYMVGCGLGGGDWSIVQKIIEKTFENYRGNVYICKHE